MKINNIRARNILGARDIDVSPTKPVVLFCGFNGAGKSSIQESLRLAFQGTTLRVSHKKDFGLMVTDGAKEGFVKITADDQVYEYRLPTGEQTVPALSVPAEQLNAVLDAQRFASMTADQRREFLTVLTKSKPNKEKVRQLMLEAGLDEARIDLALPMLMSGFPAACEMAKSKATEAKGAWKQLTGGAWGVNKGESWEAPEVAAPAEEDIKAAAADVDTKEAALAELQQKLGGLVEKFNAQKARVNERANAEKKAATLDRLIDKDVRDKAALDAYNKELDELKARAGTAPKEGLIHDMARFINSIAFDQDGQDIANALISSYESEFGPVEGGGDPEAAAKIPAIEKSRDLMQRCVDNNKRDIAEAEAAKALLATLGAVEAVGDEAITEAREVIAKLQAELAAAREEHQALLTLQKAATERDAKTEAAKKHHNDVVGWLKVADQFAPEGIPSQLLAKALEPINKLLREASIATEWRQVAIAPDMAITANGRPYLLHSESERWMIDAMIAAVISQLAGLKLIVLDRFDVLDINHRPALIYWLDDMAAAGQIETALVFGTLKEAPKGLPDNTEAIWIQAGEIEGNGLLAAA